MFMKFIILQVYAFFFPIIKVYKKAMANLLPTPAKSHYTFNLRDFSRVILGCLLIKKDSVVNKHTMIRLFVHEVFRVFYDRLVDDADRAWVFKLIKEIVKEHFKEAFDAVFSNLRQGNAPVSIHYLVKKNDLLFIFVWSVLLEIEQNLTIVCHSIWQK